MGSSLLYHLRSSRDPELTPSFECGRELKRVPSSSQSQPVLKWEANSFQLYDHSRMQARSCLGSALSSPPLRGQQALPVQRPEVCSFHGGSCFWPQAVTGILFLLTASFLLDFPQFPDWPPPRYHLTLLFLFSAQIYLIYTLFSFLCVRMCVCTCHRLLYSTLLQPLLWFSWLGRNK